MSELALCNRHSLFGGFTPEDLSRVETLFETRTGTEGAVLITEDQPNDAIWFLLSGTVRVSRGGKDIIDFKEGDSFGEIEMLDTKPAAATIRALEPYRAACLGHRGLYQLYKLDTRLYSVFMMNLARDLARRLRRMDELMIHQ
jgi:CRP-like cAMP-binding protein